MPDYDLNFFDLSQMHTSNWGAVHSPDGGSWNVGTDTIYLYPWAIIDTVSVTDDDGSFADDDFTQSLTYDYFPFWAGTNVQNEYMLTVEDALGNQYELAAVTADHNNFFVEWFAFVGAAPPTGENLLIVGVQDSASMSYSPACFTPGAMVRTERGEVPVEHLRESEMVWTLDHGAQPLRMVAGRHLRFSAGPHPHKPILIPAGTIGSGGRLVVSPQHRLLLRCDRRGEVLVPAKSLLALRGVRVMQGKRAVQYLHLAFERHEIIMVDGVLTESLHAGPMALRGLAPAAQQRLRRIIGAPGASAPARPMLTVRDGRALAARHAGRGLPTPVPVLNRKGVRA
ncbi:Hint domain-containing protein [Sulfitobacter sp. G21635-S1]|uniref:Hint domain-containing protein n=1 Tax=Sulfitobacter sp. G21635-S1 TaxID=3014043 RepID=UPI0022AEF48F|nr:Hint domain-containing protein [Sulfitobacter sp. G21635-S1]MCZ4259051.1 Hint domain-containing protein [Sulfitobacter sp. G21635-S1]